jgi:hypothetical protein
MSYDEMRAYFSYLRANTGPLDVTIDWEVIDAARIAAYSAGKRMGLQLADAVASSFFYAVEPSQYGYTEDRYARMLKPVVWHRNGRYLGYGLKPWPREIDDIIKGRKSLAWIGEEYE